MTGEEPVPRASAVGRPRALLVLGRLQVGVLVLSAGLLLGGTVVAWVLSDRRWPSGTEVEVATGVGALVLAALWLAATRPAWSGRVGPLLLVAVLTLPVVVAAGIWALTAGVPPVPFLAVVLPVAVLVVRARQRRHPTH